MISSFTNRLLVGVALLSSLGVFEAKADLFSTCGVDLGAAGRTKQWAIFSLGAGVSDSDDLSGNDDITGDVGVAGSGDISLNGNVTIHGDLYYKTSGTLKMNGNSKITGVKHHNAASDTLLNQGVIDATNASTVAFNHAVSPQYASRTSIRLGSNQSLTLSGAPNECVVLKLTDFVLTGGTLTLSGSTSTAFIINVTNQFSLTSASKIMLSGGVTWDSVLFNVRGSGNVTLDGQSTLNGILMANNRTVQMAGGSKVIGEIIANKVKLSGGSSVVNPPVSSP
jgi:fibronectin-binding autotransporter adhesin